MVVFPINDIPDMEPWRGAGPLNGSIWADKVGCQLDEPYGLSGDP